MTRKSHAQFPNQFREHCAMHEGSTSYGGRPRVAEGDDPMKLYEAPTARAGIGWNPAGHGAFPQRGRWAMAEADEVVSSASFSRNLEDSPSTAPTRSMDQSSRLGPGLTMKDWMWRKRRFGVPVRCRRAAGTTSAILLLLAGIRGSAGAEAPDSTATPVVAAAGPHRADARAAQQRSGELGIAPLRAPIGRAGLGVRHHRRGHPALRRQDAA